MMLEFTYTLCNEYSYFLRSSESIIFIAYVSVLAISVVRNLIDWLFDNKTNYSLAITAMVSMTCLNMSQSPITHRESISSEVSCTSDIACLSLSWDMVMGSWWIFLIAISWSVFTILRNRRHREPIPAWSGYVILMANLFSILSIVTQSQYWVERVQWTIREHSPSYSLWYTDAHIYYVSLGFIFALCSIVVVILPSVTAITLLIRRDSIRTV